MWQFLRRKIKMQSLSAAESRTSTVKRLDEIFRKKSIHAENFDPGDTRAALEVFRVYEAEGEYFDISRIPAVIDQHQCLHCGRCAETCPRGTIRKRGQ